MDGWRSERGGVALLAVLLVLIAGLLIARQWQVHQRSAPPRSAGIPATSPSQAPAHAPIPSSPRIDAPVAQAPRPQVVDARLPSPTSSYANALGDIDTLIKQEKLAEARARLVAIPSDGRLDPVVRAEVSTLWTHLGLALAKPEASGEDSVEAFKTALSLDPNNRGAYLHLVTTYWKRKDPALTTEMVERAARLAPDDPMPHVILAQRFIEKDELDAAATHLELAKARSGSSPEQQQYLNAQMAHLEKARRSEQRFQARDSSHFTVKYDGGEDHAVWTRVLDILEEAYRDMGQQLGHYPRNPILVVLHTRERFHDATGGPAWSDGLYDPMLGRIKIPTQGALTDQVRLTQVLRHEYVHALLNDRLQGRRLPQWLNEGLAMQLSGEPTADIPDVLVPGSALFSLSSLEGPWGGLPTHYARLAYTEGSSATRYLIDRFGLGVVRDLLDQLGKGEPFPAAFKDRVFISYEEFQRRWVENLNQTIENRRS